MSNVSWMCLWQLRVAVLSSGSFQVEDGRGTSPTRGRFKAHDGSAVWLDCKEATVYSCLNVFYSLREITVFTSSHVKFP